MLRLKIGDAAVQRWEVPQWLLASELLPGSSGGPGGAAAVGGGSGAASTGPLFELSVKQEPFSLEVTRSQAQAAGGSAGAGEGAGRTVFNSTATRLVFKASAAGPGLSCVAAFHAWAPRFLHDARAHLDSLLRRRASPSLLPLPALVPAGSIPGAFHLAQPLCGAVWRRRARLAHPAPRVSPRRLPSPRCMCPGAGACGPACRLLPACWRGWCCAAASQALGRPAGRRRRNGMPRTLWNHDLGPTFPEQNMYGSHPFVMALEPGAGRRLCVWRAWAHKRLRCGLAPSKPADKAGCAHACPAQHWR